MNVIEARAEHDKFSHPDRAVIIDCLKKLNIPTEEWYIAHLAALLQALRIYHDRFPKYRDEPIWDMGVKGCLVQARTCVSRLWAVYGPGAPNSTLRAGKPVKMDDAYDGINYLVHVIRQANGQNNGVWQWERRG